MPRPAASIERRATCGTVQGGFAPPTDLLHGALAAPVLLVVPLAVLLLVVRRASGALVQPLPSIGLVVCGLVLAGWAVLARDWLTKCASATESWQRTAKRLLAALLVVACLAPVLPGSPLLGIVGLVGIVAVEEAAAWAWRRCGNAGPRPTERRLVTSLESPQPGASDQRYAQDVIAQSVRSREADGRESIHGWTRVEFAAGQRSAPVHVAFCPALLGMPHCEAEPSAGPAASVRVAQVLPYGARFDVKLEAPATRPVTVEIEFSATASSSNELSANESSAIESSATGADSDVVLQ